MKRCVAAWVAAIVVSGQSLAASEPEAAIWQRTIDPDSGNLSPEAARAFLKLAFTEEDHRAMDELARKYVETRDPKIREEIYRLGRELEKLEN